MNIELLGSEDIGGYKLRAFRSDAKTDIFRRKSFDDVWPGSREIVLAGYQTHFMAPVGGRHIRRLRAPGTKRLFFLQDVWMPWKIQKRMNILFGYQIETTGEIYFLVEESQEITAVIKKSANASRKTNLIAFVVAFPLSLFFMNRLFSKHNSVIKPAPPQDSLQTFVADNYMKS